MIAAFVGMGCFWPKKRFWKNALKMKQPMETSEASQSSKIFCNICMDTKAQSKMFSNGTVCGHLFCLDCIRTYVKRKIKQNIAEVKCPDPKCKGVIGPALCSTVIPKKLLDRWEGALLMELAKKNKWRRCPSCKYFVEKQDGCNRIVCRCRYIFCYRCGKKDDGEHVCNGSE